VRKLLRKLFRKKPERKPEPERLPTLKKNTLVRPGG
jgi:hypothetical protein